MNQPLPSLAVTLGDPAGIGPEVILKALADPLLQQNCSVTVIGSRRLLELAYLELQQQQNCSGQLVPLVHPAQLTIVEPPSIAPLEKQVMVGQGNAASGELGFACLKTAIQKALEGQFQGIVTAPISKAGWKAAGHDYPGQTELLAELSGRTRFGMLFAARSPHTGWILRALLATTHISLRQVPDALTPELLSAKLELLIESLLQDFGLQSPRIAIAGLNPHSGEQGQLGQEEQDWLIPWLEKVRSQFSQLRIEGPIPPDTLWVKPGQAWYGHGSASNVHDAYLALYHDQGLIPVKLLAFDRAVNVTIGLPFIRTSPDHGTAFDIAGRGIADAASMKEALRLAIEIVHQRQASQSGHTKDE